MLQRIFTMQRYYGFLTISVNVCILAGKKFLVRFWYQVLSAITVGNTG